MSQAIFSSIVPSTTSGNQLATILNDFKEAVISGFSGTSRPSELDAGGYWVDTTDTNIWVYKLYTGVQDITVFSLNLTTGLSSISQADSSFEVAKVSNDAVGALLKLVKERITGGGQTLDGDTIGEVQFYSTRDSGVNVETAAIKAVSSDNVTSSAQGSYLVFEASEDATSAPVEMMRLKDKKLGINEAAPEEALHVVGNAKVERESDDTVGAYLFTKKKRISNNGQVLSGDIVSKVEFLSTDNNGGEFGAVKLETSAIENHTPSLQGTKLSLSTKKTGQNSYSEQMVLGDKIELKNNVSLTGDLDNLSSVVLGDPTVNGSWRFIVVAGNLEIQVRTAGNWVTKDTIQP